MLMHKNQALQVFYVRKIQFEENPAHLDELVECLNDFAYALKHGINRLEGMKDGHNNHGLAAVWQMKYVEERNSLVSRVCDELLQI